MQRQRKYVVEANILHTFFPQIDRVSLLKTPLKVLNSFLRVTNIPHCVTDGYVGWWDWMLVFFTNSHHVRLLLSPTCYLKAAPHY